MSDNANYKLNNSNNSHKQNKIQLEKNNPSNSDSTSLSLSTSVLVIFTIMGAHLNFRMKEFVMMQTSTLPAIQFMNAPVAMTVMTAIPVTSKEVEHVKLV